VAGEQETRRTANKIIGVFFFKYMKMILPKDNLKIRGAGDCASYQVCGEN